MKTNFKRFTLLLIAVMMMTVISGCKKNDADDTTATGTTGTTEATTEPTVIQPDYPLDVEELGSGIEKWSEEETTFGYKVVSNTGGETLGYSTDSGVELIQVDGFAFKDLNGNNKLDQYEDWREADADRAADLASQLSVEQISALMLVGNHGRFNDAKDDLNDSSKADLDKGIRFVINRPGLSVEEMAKFNNLYQAYAEGSDFGIPTNVSTDPRDSGVSSIPSNLALAATFDPTFVEELAKLTAIEYRLLGLGTLLGPQIDLTTEPRWNRIDGTFGEDPALARDLTSAFVNGLQSTFAADGTDLGWGSESLNAMIKHWPGEGAAESGREGHNYRGSSQVFPGGQFTTQLIPFVDGGFNLEGLTGSATAVMSSYSIHFGENYEDKTYGELVGTAYSEWKVKELLRAQYGFDGVVTTDWGAAGNSGYGAVDSDSLFGQSMLSDLAEEERLLLMIMAGVDQIGGYNKPEKIVEAYETGQFTIGESVIRARFELAATRLLKTTFVIGLFENPYVNVDVAKATVASEANLALTYSAQLKSIVMLKNENNAIAQNDGTSTEKPTVYVPMSFTPSTASWGRVTPASWKLPVERDLLEKYFTVVTDTVSDTLTGPVDGDGNPTLSQNDIVRATPTELESVDFALPIIKAPVNEGSYFAGFGWDPVAKEFIPISLQYGPYTADGENVRQESLTGDLSIIEEGTGYDVESVIHMDHNRGYYGKDAIIHNQSDLEAVMYASQHVDKVIVAIKAYGPMIFSEIEPYADAILIGFGGSTGSGYGIEDEALLEIALGNYQPSALLPLQMPKDMDTVEGQFEDVPRDMEVYEDTLGNKYDFAYGMDWSGVISDDRTTTYDVDPLVEPANSGN